MNNSQTSAACAGSVDETEIVDVGPPEPASGTRSSGPAGPAARIGLIEPGGRPRFSAETESLLRGRLRAAAIDLIVILGLGFVGNSLAGNFQWLLLRVLILSLVIASYFLLRGSRPLNIRALRSIEAILFGGVALQVALMMYARVLAYGKAGDAVSMHTAADFFVAAFCLHILTYGIFMPNSWKRAAIVMLVFAAIPYAVWFGILWTVPECASLAAANRAMWPIPVPLMAALIGTWGSHIIHRTRREAFQARQLLQYRLQDQIGSGGMGEVYRAEHVLLKRPCAIKLIRPDRAGDQSNLKLFEREVIATARLSHWNKVDIYDYGHTEDGTFFYVMELLEGASLQSLVQRCGPLPPERAAWLLAQVCDALEEAHRAGLIHRDIKPANIFVSRRGGQWDVAKLLDFGLVREVSESSPAEAVQRGFSGTPAWMAPEQALHYHSVDGRADLYALGAVAWYMLTGKPPFSDRDIGQLLLAHATRPVDPPSSVVAGIPHDIEQVVLRCMEKDPAERFQSARDLAAALRSCECAGRWNADFAQAWWSANLGQSRC